MNIRSVNRKIRPAVASVDRGSNEVDVDAPDGSVGVATGLHWASYPFERGQEAVWGYETLQDVYARIVTDWQDGCKPCEAEDCDICADAGQQRSGTPPARIRGKTPRQWVALHERMAFPPACEYGHDECSCTAKPGGPCVAEMMALDESGEGTR